MTKTNKWLKPKKIFGWKKKGDDGVWRMVYDSDEPEAQYLDRGYWQVCVKVEDKRKGLSCYHLSVGYIKETTLVHLVKEGKQYIIKR